MHKKIPEKPVIIFWISRTNVVAEAVISDTEGRSVQFEKIVGSLHVVPEWDNVEERNPKKWVLLANKQPTFNLECATAEDAVIQFQQTEEEINEEEEDSKNLL
jgi:hypothetical protein